MKRVLTDEVKNHEAMTLQELIEEVRNLENFKKEAEARLKSAKQKLKEEVNELGGEYEDEKFKVAIKYIESKTLDREKLKEMLNEEEIPYKTTKSERMNIDRVD